MLTKRTSKNQVTIPKAVIEYFSETEYFDASVQDGAILLRPVTLSTKSGQMDKVREKIQKLGITEKDIDDAISWARRKAK